MKLGKDIKNKLMEQFGDNMRISLYDQLSILFSRQSRHQMLDKLSDPFSRQFRSRLSFPLMRILNEAR